MWREFLIAQRRNCGRDYSRDEYYPDLSCNEMKYGDSSLELRSQELNRMKKKFD